MSAGLVLREDSCYYTYHYFEETLQKIDNVADRRECDFLGLGTNLPNSLGKRLSQSFDVGQLETFYKRICTELPSFETNLRAKNKRHTLIKVVIAIAGIITGICLVKSVGSTYSGNDIGKLVSGILLIGGSGGVLVGSSLAHCQKTIEGSIVSVQKAITALGEVLEAAKAKQSETNEKLSKSMRDWYMQFRIERLNKPSRAPVRTIQVLVIPDATAPLLTNPAPSSAIDYKS
jgi:hypothetical protein